VEAEGFLQAAQALGDKCNFELRGIRGPEFTG
jgi:hypothetical protein